MSNFSDFNSGDYKKSYNNTNNHGSYSEPFRNIENFNSQDHFNNLDRIDMERGMTAYSSPRTKRYMLNDKKRNNRRYQDNDKIGEITGRYVEYEDLEQGMPIRSEETYEMFNRREVANPHLDFDIYDKQNSTDFNVNYYDPNPGNSNFASLNADSRIIKSFENTDLSKEANQFAFHLFKSLKKRVTNDVCFSPSNLLNCLVTFMGGSTGYVYQVIDTVFGENSPSEIINALEKIKGQKDLNIVYLPKQNRLNPAFRSLMSNIVSLENYDPKNHNSVEKINKVFYSYTKGEIKSVINREKLDGNMLSVNCTVYKTEWENFPCVVKKLRFNGKLRNFMVAKNTNQKFFGSKNCKLVELDLQDGSVIGFFKGDISEIDMCINNLTLTNFEHLSFPIFKKHTKYNFTQILKALGLDIFDDTDFQNITPEYVSINNIVQETKVQILPSRTDTIKSLGKGISLSFNSRFICYIKKNGIITHLLEMS
uniref:Serpin domain-containing protein n=1 Tax=viral metagenome TaxID=1070528 RepID=A0A6C0ACA2_9ZZZZ